MVAQVVSEKRLSGEHPLIEYRLRVEQVLKGQVCGNELTIAVGPWRPLADPPEALPDAGTRVFVLLDQRDGGSSLAADLNAVGIIENNQVVALHQGFRVGIDGETWTPEEYVAVYQAYYERKLQAERIDEPGPLPSTPEWSSPRVYKAEIVDRRQQDDKVIFSVRFRRSTAVALVTSAGKSPGPTARCRPGRTDCTAA